MDDVNSKCVMKKWGYIIAAAFLAVGAAGCSSAYFATAGYANDDLYAVHSREEIARRKEAEAAAKKAEAEARRAEWEARIAEAEAAAAQNRYYSQSAVSSNPYEEVLADTYESAYARRLRGFESPTYNMPSSYYNFRYGNAFNYVSAYDPAFYNVMVMGDQVWVEPKYITAMFGTWGRPAIYADPWYYGWSSRSRWGFSIGSWGWGFGLGYSWYDPWYDPWYASWYHPWYHPWWGPAWGPFRPGHPHWGGGHGHPHRRYAADIVHRADPNTSPSGQRYGGPGQRFGGGSAASSIRNGGSFGVRNSSGGSNRYTSPSGSGDRYNRGSGSSSRDNSGSSSYNRGGNSYNRGGSYNSGSPSRGGSSGFSGGSGSRSSGGSYRNAGGR